MKKRLLSVLLILGMVVTAFCGCGSASREGEVYYLNFKPEQDEAWQSLARCYTEKTGVQVTVVTAAGGQYETTLMSEMGKSSAPTLFQVNGPVGLKNWKDYCYDLSEESVYSELTNDAFALKEDGAVYGVGYVIESYGIIANKSLLAKAGYDAAYKNLEKVMINPKKPNKNKGEACSLAYAKATGIPVFATDEMDLQPIIDKQLNTGIDDIICIRIVDIIIKARDGEVNVPRKVAKALWLIAGKNKDTFDTEIWPVKVE